MTKDVNYQTIEKEAEKVPTVGFKKLNSEAILPTKGHDTDSGFDLYALEDTIIYPGQTVIVKTGVAVALPEGLDATIRPRSGNTVKTKLRVQLGTIDKAYVGELGVIVDNTNQSHASTISVISEVVLSALKVLNTNNEKLEEIKENIIEPVQNVLFSKELHTLKGVEKSDIDYPIGTYLVRKGDKIAQLVVHPYYDKSSIQVEELEETERGANGFGSTGV